MKATAIAPSNIAFVKYWGKKDSVLRLPENGSISMNLSNLTTTTTVEFSRDIMHDTIVIDGQIDQQEGERVSRHLDRIRLLANTITKAKVVSINSFPSKRGLSSSASGFAALTVAGCGALNLSISEKDLSILARQGSGSACRSIPDGFVEWIDGDTSETSYARSLHDSTYWDLCDVVVITGTEKKDVPTQEGMKAVSSSPFFPLRLSGMADKIQKTKEYIKEKNFDLLGPLIEREALEMHAVMLTSSPALIYWTAGTLHIMKQVIKWRKEGIAVYFSINTGQDIHLLCEKPTVNILLDKLKQEKGILDIIVNHPCSGASLTNQHLF